ncbi:MAG: Na(+)-translocating NADH-quinone reductase subunit C [Polyangia bacterium]
MRKPSALYTLGFAAAVCAVCSVLVSVAAVTLRPRQEKNALLDRRKNVLVAAGLLETGDEAGRDRIDDLFQKRIRSRVVRRESGAAARGVDPIEYDQRRAAQDPERSSAAPPNPAAIRRVPRVLRFYEVLSEGEVEMYVLPVRGKGLWSTLYGYLALDRDTSTVRGIAFYEHGETPGLGGEIGNPDWQRRWRGREVFDEDWEPVIRVIKGAAGPPEEDPHSVDGLSGATLTADGVTALVRFWTGENGFGPFLGRARGKGDE